jgi:uncharacterized protein (DUF4415 family)
MSVEASDLACRSRDAALRQIGHLYLSFFGSTSIFSAAEAECHCCRRQNDRTSVRTRRLPPRTRRAFLSKKLDADNPEWTQDDFAKAPEDILPADVLANFKHRGPQRAPKKVPVSIRLDPMVVTYFKQEGPGWQAGKLAVLPKTKLPPTGSSRAPASNPIGISFLPVLTDGYVAACGRWLRRD